MLPKQFFKVKGSHKIANRAYCPACLFMMAILFYCLDAISCIYSSG
jgi:hypothetical protein